MNLNTGSLFTREAHLSELTVNRHLAGELAGDESATVSKHLQQCQECDGFVESVRSMDISVALPTLQLPKMEPAPAQTPWSDRLRTSWVRWCGAGALGLAATAALVLMARVPADEVQTPDRTRVKGGTFAMALFVDDEAEGRAVETGDLVHPGDRIGFQVFPKNDGHLLILGIDEAGESYLCYPQEGNGASAPIAAEPSGVSINEAIRLDEVLGHERIIGIFCPDAFDFAAAQKAVSKQRGSLAKMPVLMPGCKQQEIRLTKTAP